MFKKIVLMAAALAAVTTAASAETYVSPIGGSVVFANNTNTAVWVSDIGAEPINVTFVQMNERPECWLAMTEKFAANIFCTNTEGDGIAPIMMRPSNDVYRKVN